MAVMGTSQYRRTVPRLTDLEGKEYVATIEVMQMILDEACGNPDVWLTRRDDYLALARKLDGLKLRRRRRAERAEVCWSRSANSSRATGWRKR